MTVFELVGTILLILFLVAISAVFSATETAYFAASKPKLRAKAKLGDVSAAIAEYLRNHMERVISTILVCSTMFNNYANSVATNLLYQYFGESSEIITTIIMTLLIVIFAELLPKFFVIRRAEVVAIGMAKILKFLIFVVKPFAWCTEKAAKGFLILLGGTAPDNEQSNSYEEIRGSISLLEEGGESTREAQVMLNSILDMEQVRIEEIMIHHQDVKIIHLEQDLSQIRDQIIHSHHTRLPLCQGGLDHVVGILHTKDFLRLIQEHGFENLKKDLLVKTAKKPWFVPETATLSEQLQAFRRRREHMAMVVDEYGTLQGIVTLEDIIEEIVGHIHDEHDPHLLGMWRGKDGEIFATGHTTLRDINRQFGWELDDLEASTIAGLLMNQSQTIPEVDQVFQIGNLKVQVMRRERNQISLVKIVPMIEKKDTHK